MLKKSNLGIINILVMRLYLPPIAKFATINIQKMLFCACKSSIPKIFFDISYTNYKKFLYEITSKMTFCVNVIYQKKNC